MIISLFRRSLSLVRLNQAHRQIHSALRQTPGPASVPVVLFPGSLPPVRHSPGSQQKTAQGRLCRPRAVPSPEKNGVPERRIPQQRKKSVFSAKPQPDMYAMAVTKSRRERTNACGDVVRVGRLELPASCSQSKRATNCATPGYEIF